MNEEFDINEKQTTFDFKGYIIRLLAHWPLFLIFLVIAFSIAYYVNVRKLPVYMIENLVSIRDDQNPFFTSNTSLVFNWGGTTDKVNTSIITLRSRSHNEKVVERLQYYMNYYVDGKYQQIDAYGRTPFVVRIDTSRAQLLNQQLKIEFKDSVNFTLTLDVIEDRNFVLQNYSTKEKTRLYIQAGTYEEDYKIGERIQLPYFSGTFMPNPDVMTRPGVPYYIQFSDFDNSVKRYLSVRVSPESKGSSVLKMGMVGENKAKLVDYLNESVNVLSEDMLERKNLFATKTIQFIDSTLNKKLEELSRVEDELNAFRDRTAIYDLDREGTELSSRLSSLDLKKEDIYRQLDYYQILKEYLNTRSDYRNVPAPSVAGITEGSVVSGVGQIVQLSQERSKLQYTFKDDAPIFNDIDRQIDAIKVVLLENIRSSEGLLRKELNDIDRDIQRYEGEIRRLPREQQDLLRIQRRYNISQGAYNLFLSKKSEAELVKAANVSDVMVIDSAKDTGGGQIGPNTQLNYVMAGLFGFFIPLLLVFVRVFLDNKIRDLKELERISPLPVLGIIGKNPTDTNLAVFDSPKSAISEAFRNLRSSLQFVYKKQGIVGSKTVLITSSVSGEGKTFCSVNLASVFALSGKRTVVLDLDLRKPKIAQYFNISNKKGVVNYLINEVVIDTIVYTTEFENLDVIVSGPVPPNPSELLMNQRLDELLDELKKRYDYIVIDSPPMGLVTDSLELAKHVDATLYIARHKYTHKNMLSFVNDKYQRGEIKHISLILNDYMEGRGYGYSYGYGYNYGYGSYGNGYHEHVKKKSFIKRIKNKFKSN